MEALKMEGPMDNWNDSRLDELSRRMDGGFTKVDERFVRLEGEMKAGFEKTAMKEELREVKWSSRASWGKSMPGSDGSTSGSISS
jgi:hypothetical protein